VQVVWRLGHTLSMTAGETLGAVGAAGLVESVHVSALAESLTAAATEHLGATSVELYLVGYRLGRLHPLIRPERGEGALAEVDRSRAGDVFVSQQPRTDTEGDETVVLLPVSAHSDRLGVLELRFAQSTVGEGGAASAGVAGQRLDDLARLADAIGRTVRAASSDTDVVETAVRSQRLSLAAELQWQLLPGRGCRVDGCELAGQLEPAYQVAGDSFDWSVNPDEVWVSVTDGPGRGVAAAQLSTLAVTALRNARRGGHGLADQARMADEAVYGAHRGELGVQALLLRFDRRHGSVTAVGAGSPRLIVERSGSISSVELDTQLPLGMFEGTLYRAEPVPVEPGDRVVIVSDGLHGAQISGAPAFGSEPLADAVRAHRQLPPGEAVRRLIEDLVSYHAGNELRDDAVAVVVDWQPGSTRSRGATATSQEQP